VHPSSLPKSCLIAATYLSSSELAVGMKRRCGCFLPVKRMVSSSIVVVVVTGWPGRLNRPPPIATIFPILCVGSDAYFKVANVHNL